MKQFLEGLQKIEESSRKYTADTLLSIANIFANRGRGKKDGGKKITIRLKVKTVTKRFLF